MNSSIIMADRTTHLKIVIVSLLASILLLWVGIGARAFLGDVRTGRRRPCAG